MSNVESTPQLVVVANTGPMVSAFQSGRVDLLQAVFNIIYLAPSTVSEHEKHGAGEFLLQLINSGLVVILSLSSEEQVRAMVVAQQIATSLLSRDPVVASHIPDAETIVLAQRLGGECDFVLLDEMAAREVATSLGLHVTGFLGTLRFAYLRGLVTVKEIENILRECQRQGTHYSNALIHDFCEMLRRGLL
jgi:predicted nucleic acid-binding protein